MGEGWVHSPYFSGSLAESELARRQEKFAARVAMHRGEGMGLHVSIVLRCGVIIGKVCQYIYKEFRTVADLVEI